MNDKFAENNRAEDIAQKLDQVVEQTKVNPQFAAELEQRLREAHRPKSSRLALSFKQISPTLRWVGLMVLLGLVLSLSIKTLIPAPQPGEQDRTSTQAAGQTPTPAPAETNATPVPQGQTFDYGGSKLIVNAQLPDLPAQANVYKVLDPKPATAEYAQALAEQFGIEGEVYTTQGYSSEETAFMVTDGKQRLLVYGENTYTYTADMVKYSRNFNGLPEVPNENAEATIREYLTTHGFDFNFRMELGNTSGGYRLQQLSPDGLPTAWSSMFVTLDENGDILNIDASLVSYEAVPLGSYGIITAEEALHRLVEDGFPIGVTQSGSSMPDPGLEPPQFWYYDHPDNQTVTVYGNIASHQAVDPNVPAMIFLDSVPVIGNTDGLEALEDFALIQATGQFLVENGVRKLSVEAWSQDVQSTCASGSARRAGEQVIMINRDDNNSESILVDPPADLPLDTDTTSPGSILISCGVLVDGQFHWTSIQYFPDASQRGGGGGGGGYFYQLNLSGTPVPFPTVAPTQASPYSPAELSSFPSYTVQPGDTCGSLADFFGVSVQSIVTVNNLSADCILSEGQTLTIPTTHLEGERGMVRVQIFENSEGRQRTSYIFTSEGSSAYYQLQGDNLEPLQKVANRPIKIWGDISPNEKGVPNLDVERFEAIYPDLQFQVLTGRQELKEINGEEVVLFTTGGITYVQMSSDGAYPDGNYLQDTEEVQMEVLQIPEETYAGYPVLRTFMIGPTINPTTGKPLKFEHTADEIEVIPDPWGADEPFTAPDITIEKVELVYFVNGSIDPSEPTHVQRYVQPVWHFQGHSEHGGESSIFVQALSQEYLLPEPEE